MIKKAEVPTNHANKRISIYQYYEQKTIKQHPGPETRATELLCTAAQRMFNQTQNKNKIIKNKRETKNNKKNKTKTAKQQQKTKAKQ